MQRSAVLVAVFALAFALARARPDDAGARETVLSVSDQAEDLPAALPPGVGARLLREFRGARDEDALASVVAPLELRILIATLPDPDASHLDWAFDSHLDAIRRGFERAGWVLDRFELPWSGKEVGAADGAAALGALLFRFNDAERTRVALLYVVGEVSTSGIDREAFTAALEERSDLLRCLQSPPAPGAASSDPATAGSTLRIIGPVFSGSAGSLREALEAGQPHLGGVKDVHIVSGAATSTRNHATISRVATDGVPGIDFRTTLHTDDTLLAVFRERVLPALGLAEREIAVLKEGTTAYGSALGANSMLVVPFPMSISSLRQAYESNGKAVRSELALPGRSASTNVPLDLEDQAQFAETPAASSSLTPPSIDLMLEQTTHVLAQGGIKGVLLFATDVRDKLFLGSELKRRLPDLQLFTTESNVLYLWPGLNRWLRGMVVLSTYPLLQRSDTDQQLIFPNEGAEGTYNATLDHLGARGEFADYGLRDARQPSKPVRPPVWVTTVGAGALLPLVAFDPEELALAQRPPSWAPQWIGAADRVTGTRRSERGFLGVATVFAFSCWLLFVFGRAWRESLADSAFSCRLLARAGAERGPAEVHVISLALHHELYTLCQLSALWSLLLPNAALLLVLASSLGRPGTATVVAVVALLASMGGLVVIARRAWRYVGDRRAYGSSSVDFGPVSPEPSRAQQWRWGMERFLRIALFLLGVAYFVGTLWLSVRIVHLALGGDALRFELFLDRSIEIDQGISALVPTTLIGLVLAAWCAWHLRRLRELARSEPAESAIDEALRRAGDESAPAARLRRRLFRTIPDSRTLLLMLPVASVLAWLWFHVERPLDDLPLGWVVAGFHGPSAFALLFSWGVVAAIAASAWAILRLAALWQALSCLLDALARRIGTLPFADFKARLKVTVNLNLLPSSFVELERDARRCWGALLALGTPANPVLAQALANPELPAAAAVRRDAVGLPRPELATALGELMSVEQSGLAEPERKLVDEVVAIELLLYVEWVLRHVRRLALFLVLAILLTTALVWSYPYQPQHMVQSVSLFIFVSAIVVLVWLVAMMNRNPPLSRLAVTDPGLTWDRGLVMNLLVFGAGPLLAMLTTSSPSLRQILDDALKPVLSALSGG